MINLNLTRGLQCLLLYLASQSVMFAETLPAMDEAVSSSELISLSEKKADTRDPSAVIDELRSRIEALEKIIATQASPTSVGDDNNIESSAEDTETARRIEQARRENLSLIESAFSRTLVEEGGLLLQPGQFNYVPTISYTYSSSDRIVVDGFTIEDILVVGDIVSRQVRRDQIVLTNAFRLGLKNDVQIDMQIPVGREKLQSYSSSGDEERESASGLGDISLSLGYQLVKAHAAWPDTLINLSWKSKSGEDPYGLASDEELALGTGFESWGLSFTTVSVSDPVVFFSGMSFTDNRGEVKSLGDVDPGDTLGVHLGMVFALNLNTSMSYGFQLGATEKTAIDGQNIPGSNLLTSMMTLGVSRILTRQLALDVQIGIGLTRDSPDVQLSLSMPWSSL